MVAQRIKDIPPSLTIKLTDRVRELRRKGMDRSPSSSLTG